MFNLFMMTIGSLLIGFGTNSWMVGVGVFTISFGFTVHFNTSLTHIAEALARIIRERR